MLSLIDKELFHAQNVYPLWQGSADELEHELIGTKSSVRLEASKVLSWNNACGTYLSRIAKDTPTRIEYSRTNSVRLWTIHPPAA